MKEIKLIIVLLLIATSWAVSSKEIDDFDYDGISTTQSIFLSHLERDNYGNYHQIKTQAKLNFENSSKALGEAINITVNMNGTDIGMMASTNTNKLSLLKLKSSDSWITENTLNILMEVDIRFIDDLSSQVRPYRNKLNDLKVNDDFVSFTSGKITEAKYVNAQLQIFRKKVLSKDELVFEKILNNNEFIVTDFGNDRSLVTIDINQIIAQLERGKKHYVKVTLIHNFNKWRPFSASQAQLFKSPDIVSVETDFRYSK